MNKMQRKTNGITLLTAACIGITLSGCAADEKISDNQNMGQEITVSNTQTPETAADKDMVNETIETTPSSQSLYEQFLNNDIPVFFNSNYTENDYLEPILENGSSYTLAELGKCVSEYYLDPERTDKASYDYVQYAYVECPDTADTNDKNLLVKFIGLNIYCSDDDSYAVFVITDDNGQLYVTDTYECWARSETTAYTNGTLSGFGSNGALDHSGELSVILSNGKQAPIYDVRIVSEDSHLTFFFYTIGKEKYYQYDMSDCPEEEKAQCEDYINNYWNETDISWSTEEEIQTAIQNRCSAIGVDYSITQSPEEVVWNNHSD